MNIRILSQVIVLFNIFILNAQDQIAPDQALQALRIYENACILSRNALINAPNTQTKEAFNDFCIVSQNYNRLSQIALTHPKLSRRARLKIYSFNHKCDITRAIYSPKQI